MNGKASSLLFTSNKHSGGAIQEIRPGDVVWISAWREALEGAAVTTGMTHVAIPRRSTARAWSGWSTSQMSNTGPEVCSIECCLVIAPCPGSASFDRYDVRKPVYWAPAPAPQSKAAALG